MTIFVAGGTGFIGRRLVPLLVQRGEQIVCMDINPQTADFGDLGSQVKVVRGDVSLAEPCAGTSSNLSTNRWANRHSSRLRPTFGERTACLTRLRRHSPRASLL